jgi:hypothetical protein
MVITATISEASILVLLIKGIWKYTLGMSSRGMKYTKSFMRIGRGVQGKN